MSRYWKTIIAVINVVVQFINAITNDIENALADDTIVGNEWLIIGVSVLTAIGVFAKANTPPAGQASDPNISETAHR